MQCVLLLLVLMLSVTTSIMKSVRCVRSVGHFSGVSGRVHLHMSTSSTYGAKEVLQERVTITLASLYGDAVAGADPMVSASTKPDFGDYQCNAALSLAKRLKVVL